MEQDYTKRELELIFGRIDEKLNDIRSHIQETQKQFDIRLNKVDFEVKELQTQVNELGTFKTKILAVWSVGVVAAGYLLNRFL